jgi:hypothetical protein
MVLPQSGTTTALRTSAPTVVFGQAVTLTATVASSAGKPTGTVTFFDGTTVLGTAVLNGGQATLSVKLGVGTHHLTASYQGNSAFFSSQSAAVTETVTPAATVTHADRTALPSNFTTTIDWGDGTSTAGVVTEDASKVFRVTGSRTYAQPGQAIRLTAAHPVRPTEELRVSVGTLVDIALETGGADAIGELAGIIHLAGGVFRKTPTPRSIRFA